MSSVLPNLTKQAAIERVQVFVEKQLFSDESSDALIPSELPCAVAEHLEGWEPVLLSTHLFSLFMRGVSIDECVEYARTREVRLPFLGCEKQLFDLLLTHMHERIDAPADVARVIELMAMYLDNLMNTVKQEICSWPEFEHQQATRSERE